MALLTLDSSDKVSDPLDKAILETASDNNVRKVDKVYPFDIAVRMSGAYIKSDKTIYIKGSPEHVITQCDLSKEQHREAESSMHTFASKGYRVIAFGRYELKNKSVPKTLEDLSKGNLQLVGFLAFADELREEVPSAIRAAQEAGISVRLITGDHYETAYNIGAQIGLASHINQVIQGKDLPKDEKEMALEIRSKTIFARILPEDKFRILKALKQTDITAMTGDGVNDVPALSNAHVGIAMGSGSDIARDAGGIVLLDDNFATIIKAIAEGRKIFDNIRRMLFYLLSTSLGEVLTMIGALLLGLPLPVTAIQILWINLVTDTALVIPLGLEPEEDGHMERPPRNQNDPLLSKVLLSRMLLVALTMAVVAVSLVAVLENQGQSTEYIQTVVFMALISAQWMNAFNARSEYKSSFSRIKKANYGLLVGLLLAASLQAVVMFGPLGFALNIQEVPISSLLVSSVIMAFCVLVVVEIHKIFARKYVQGSEKKSLA